MIVKKLNFLLILCISIGFVQCTDNPVLSDFESVSVEATTSGILIINNSSATIYYTAFERGSLASIRWAPCIDPDHCLKVKPRRFALIKYEDIHFYHKDAEEVVVYWWNLVKKPNSGEYKVVNMTSIIIET